MGFHTFDLTELPDDADDAFAIEFTTKHSKIGITLSESEAQGVAHALQDGLDGDMETWDGKNASEI